MSGAGYYGFLLDNGPAASAGAGLTYYDEVLPWTAMAMAIPTTVTDASPTLVSNPYTDVDQFPTGPYQFCPFSVPSAYSAAPPGYDFYGGIDTTFHPTLTPVATYYPATGPAPALAAPGDPALYNQGTYTLVSSSITSYGNLQTTNDTYPWWGQYATKTGADPHNGNPVYSIYQYGEQSPAVASPNLPGNPSPGPITPVLNATPGTLVASNVEDLSEINANAAAAGYPGLTEYPATTPWRTYTAASTPPATSARATSLELTWGSSLGAYTCAGTRNHKIRALGALQTASVFMPNTYYNGYGAGTILSIDRIVLPGWPDYVPYRNETALGTFAAKKVLIGPTWTVAPDPDNTCYLILKVMPDAGGVSATVSTTSGGVTTTSQYGFLFKVTDNNNSGALVGYWFIFHTGAVTQTAPYGTFTGSIDAFTGRFKPAGVRDASGNQSFHVQPWASYVSSGTANSQTTQFCLPIFGTGADVTILKGCGAPGKGGGGTPGGPGGDNGPPSAIAVDRPRQWLHVGQSSMIATFPAADPVAGSPLFTSPGYSVDSWISFKTDARRGSLLMLGQQAGSSGQSFKLFLSQDGGNTAAGVLSVYATGALIEIDSERNKIALLTQAVPATGATTTDSAVSFQVSADGGQTFAAAAACMLTVGTASPAPLTATLLSLTYNERRSALSLLCLINGHAVLLESTDVGATWVQKASLS